MLFFKLFQKNLNRGMQEGFSGVVLMALGRPEYDDMHNFKIEYS